MLKRILQTIFGKENLSDEKAGNSKVSRAYTNFAEKEKQSIKQNEVIVSTETDSSKEITDNGGTQSCNYWADKEVNYSPSFTAQEVLASNEDEEKKDDNNISSNSSGTSRGWGCGCGGCL